MVIPTSSSVSLNETSSASADVDVTNFKDSNISTTLRPCLNQKTNPQTYAIIQT
jgi:hypothetical protein